MAVAFLPAGIVTAQPPNGGPAKELFFNNTTNQAVRIRVERPGSARILILPAGRQLHTALLSITDDRLIVVSKDQNDPWTILDTAHFNAFKFGWPSIGYGLIDDGGQVRLVPYVYGGGAAGPQAVNKKDEDLIKKNKDALMKGVPKAGQAPTEKESDK
jgi:hypothetical protein